MAVIAGKSSPVAGSMIGGSLSGAARSGADLATAENDPLLAGEPLQSDRTAGVQLVGGDADLGAQPVLEAVGEARRGVDHHRAGVDLAQEAHGVGPVLGDDGVGVLRSVPADVLDRLVEVAN